VATDLEGLLARAFKQGSWPPPRTERRPDDDPVLQDPHLPAECSSSTALSVLPAVIWDVNGYYRELGVLPSATRKDLRLAYFALDGQSSVRLTYIIKQLLNKAVRFDYDCTPLGEVFLDDYVRAILDRKIKEAAAARMQRLRDMGVDSDFIDSDSIERDVRHEMGFEIDDDTPDEVVDDKDPVGQDEPVPAKFLFAYYLWAMRPSPGPDVEESRLVRLGEWQRQLVSAFSRKGLTLRFSVGLHRKPNRWVQGQIGYRTVFFINDSEENFEEVATQVADRVAAAS
jgi:hypothetical protein